MGGFVPLYSAFRVEALTVQLNPGDAGVKRFGSMAAAEKPLKECVLEPIGQHQNVRPIMKVVKQWAGCQMTSDPLKTCFLRFAFKGGVKL